MFHVCLLMEGNRIGLGGGSKESGSSRRRKGMKGEGKLEDGGEQNWRKRKRWLEEENAPNSQQKLNSTTHTPKAIPH